MSLYTNNHRHSCKIRSAYSIMNLTFVPQEVLFNGYEFQDGILCNGYRVLQDEEFWSG